MSIFQVEIRQKPLKCIAAGRMSSALFGYSVPPKTFFMRPLTEHVRAGIMNTEENI